MSAYFLIVSDNTHVFARNNPADDGYTGRVERMDLEDKIKTAWPIGDSWNAELARV